MDKKEYAIELKRNRHNCAQAVLCAYAEETGLPAEELRKMGACLGLGMGGMEGTCGALCAAEILLGLLKFEGSFLYADAAKLHEDFRKMCGATICRELKGRDTGKMLCSCDDCVRNAVALIEEMH